MFDRIHSDVAHDDGFTLIELLVVILIIGILAAVAIPTFLSQKSKASDSNAQSNLKNAQLLVESYANGANGMYPAATNQTLPSALTGDAGAAPFSTGSSAVLYSSSGGPSDTYTLCALGSQNSVPHFFFIQVNNGTAQYGTSTSGTSCGDAAAPSNYQAGGFPALTTT